MGKKVRWAAARESEKGREVNEEGRRCECVLCERACFCVSECVSFCLSVVHARTRAQHSEHDPANFFIMKKLIIFATRTQKQAAPFIICGWSGHAARGRTRRAEAVPGRGTSGWVSLLSKLKQGVGGPNLPHSNSEVHALPSHALPPMPLHVQTHAASHFCSTLSLSYTFH